MSGAGVHVKAVCSHCDRVFTRHTRKGYTVSCPHCGTVNAGPGLLAEQGKPKAEGAIRRRTRRTRSADQRAERGAEGHGGAGEPRTPGSGEHETPLAPAPVRRRRPAPPRSPGTTSERQAPVAAPAAGERPGADGSRGPGRPRGWFDRVMGYGEGGDDGD